MLSAVAGALAIAHSIGHAQELIHDTSSILDRSRDGIAFLGSPNASVSSPSECDERCRTVWGLGIYGDWDLKCAQDKCSGCSECTGDVNTPTPLDLCKKRYDNAISQFPSIEEDREARLRGDKSLDATNIPHVLFVHIGKTCGDTVIAALNHNAKKIRSLDLQEDEQQQQQQQQIRGKTYKFARGGREPFDMVHVHPVRAEVLEHVQNVLIPMRDPVDRLISAFNAAACKAEGVDANICERKVPQNRLQSKNIPPRRELGPIPEAGGLLMQCFPNVTTFGERIDEDSECGRVARDVIGLGDTDSGAGHVGKGDCYYLGGVLELLKSKNIHLIHTEQCGKDIATIAKWLGLKGENSQFDPTPDKHQGDYPHHYDTLTATGRVRLQHHLRHEYALQAEIRKLAKNRNRDGADGEPKEGCVSTGANGVSNKWCTANCGAGNCPELMCVCAGDAEKKRAAEAEAAAAEAAAERAAIDAEKAQQEEAERKREEAEKAEKAQTEAIDAAKKEQAAREAEEEQKAAEALAKEEALAAEKKRIDDAETERRLAEDAAREKAAAEKAEAEAEAAKEDEAERIAAENAAAAKAAEATAEAEKAAEANAAAKKAAEASATLPPDVLPPSNVSRPSDSSRDDGWHPEDLGLPMYAPAPEGTQGGGIGDDCWLACGKKAGACFDEKTGKGFCGRPGNWSGSCCRLGAVGDQHAAECGGSKAGPSSRGCALHHCCIDDLRLRIEEGRATQPSPKPSPSPLPYR